MRSAALSARDRSYDSREDMQPLTWQQIAAPLTLIALMLLMFWGLVIRPTKQSQQRHRDLVDSLKPGDRVVTAGGIYGKVMTVSETKVGLEIAKGLTVTFDRRAIRRFQDGEGV
jgi:preprotein translocase subunit YajC